MAPKSKKGRGKKVTMDINEFNEGYIPDDAYDWADDAWMTEEQKGEQILKEKLAAAQQNSNNFSSETRYKNDRLATGESFRTGGTQSATLDLQPPYAAHLGNLRNGMTDEEFLALFGSDCVECHRLVNQNNKTFAFVEFKTKQALLAAIAMDHTMYKGRALYVNLANEQQIARLHGEDPRANGNALAGLSRDKTGQQQPGLAQLGLSRDVFGAAEQASSPVGMPSRGPSRANLGSRVDLSDFSRDMLGTATQDAPPSSGAGSPNGMMPPKGHSLADFANWRDSDRSEQPEFAAAAAAAPETLRGKSGDDEPTAPASGPEALRRDDGPAGSAKPAAAGVRNVKNTPSVPDFGSWRDEPRVEAPARGGGGDKDKAKENEKEKEKEVGEGRGAGRGGRGGNSAGRGGARGGASGSPKAAPPAADAGDRWANLRS